MPPTRSARHSGDSAAARTGRPALRWTGRPEASADATPAVLPARAVPIGRELTGPADPRWVLALRVAQALQGPILTPERRQRMVRIGRSMGLSPFDANLVIAIVQDQARRGYAPLDCPAAGVRQLVMVPLPRPFDPQAQQRRFLVGAALIAATLAAELVVLWWLF